MKNDSWKTGPEKSTQITGKEYTDYWKRVHRLLEKYREDFPGFG